MLSNQCAIELDNSDLEEHSFDKVLGHFFFLREVAHEKKKRMWLLALPMALHMVLGPRDARDMLKRSLIPPFPRVKYASRSEVANILENKSLRRVSFRDIATNKDDYRHDLEHVCRELEGEDRFTIWTSDESGMSMIVCDASKDTKHSVTGYLWSPRCMNRLCVMKKMTMWHDAHFPKTPLTWNVSHYRGI